MAMTRLPFRFTILAIGVTAILLAVVFIDRPAHSTRPPVVISDGTYRIGTEAPAGTYRTNGAGTGCSWTLVRYDGTVDIGSVNGPTTVPVSATDRTFEVDGDCQWTLR